MDQSILDDYAGTSCRSRNPAFRRMLMITGGVLLFVGIGSLVRPSPSEAQTPRDPATRAKLRAGGQPAAIAGVAMDIADAPAHSRNLQPLGSLRGMKYHTWIYSDDEGPRFTVCDTSGRVLAEDLAAEDVYRNFPDLDIKGMILPPPDAGRPMMLATPRE